MPLYFICLPEDAAVPVGEGVATEEMIASLDKQAQALSDQNEFSPLTYLDGEREILPVFTTSERVQEFINARPPIWDYDSVKGFALQKIGMEGKEALTYLLELTQFDFVPVLDPRTSGEIVLTRADIETAFSSSG